MPYNRKPRLMLVISGIRLTFVDNFRQMADYLVHLSVTKGVGDSRGACPRNKKMIIKI